MLSQVYVRFRFNMARTPYKVIVESLSNKTTFSPSYYYNAVSLA